MLRLNSKFHLLVTPLFTVLLSNPGIASADAGTLQFSDATFNVHENDKTATITVTREGGSDGKVSVKCATSDGTATAGSDYQAIPGKLLKWADGDTASKTCNVKIINDKVFNEGYETANLTLSEPTGDAEVGGTPNATLRIADDECGMQPDWVSTCPSGTDQAKSTKGKFELWQGSCVAKTVSLGTLQFNGPTTIYRGEPQDALIGDPDFGNVGVVEGHLGVIKTEMVSLELTGSGFVVRAGDGVGNLANDGPLYSPGLILQGPGGTTATSTFNIFFEISGTSWGVLHNEDACVMAATIDRVPPYFKNENPTLNAYECDDLDVYNAANEVVACLIHVKHELPVKFSQSFTATPSQEGITLSWTTGYEEKMAGFAAYQAVALDGDCSNNQVSNFTDVTPLAWKWSGEGEPTAEGLKYSVEVTDDNESSGFCYGLLATGFDGTWELYTVGVE